MKETLPGITLHSSARNVGHWRYFLDAGEEFGAGCSWRLHIFASTALAYRSILGHSFLDLKRKLNSRKRSGRKGEARGESLHKLIAYQVHEDDSAPIRPARRERKWMEDAAGKFPYRCLPLVVANQYGWEILSTHHLRATWDGTSKPDGLYVENLSGDGSLHGNSHFGEGVLTFQIPFLFQTPEGWNLMVRGPANNPKDGIVALDGIIETDWTHSTFTMNWRFTRACTVEFALGEPICLFFPIQRGVLEKFRGELRALESNPEFERKFREWSASRDRFLYGLQKGKPKVIAQGWQKEYLQTARNKKSRAHPFVDEISWNPPEPANGNHEDPAKT